RPDARPEPTRISCLPRSISAKARREVPGVGTAILSGAETVGSEGSALLESAKGCTDTIRQIEAQIAAGRKPAKRTPVAVTAPNETLDAFLGRVLEHFSRREACPPHQGLAERPDTSVARSLRVARARLTVVPEAVDVVIDLRQTLILLDEARLGGETQLRSRRRAQVQASGRLLQRLGPEPFAAQRSLERRELVLRCRRHADGAILVFDVAAGEIADLIDAAAQLAAPLVTIAVVDRRHAVRRPHVEAPGAIQNAQGPGAARGYSRYSPPS